MIHAMIVEPTSGEDEAVVIEIVDEDGTVRQTIRVSEHAQDWGVSIIVNPT